MKLIPRHRRDRQRTARIELTQEEITADLRYPVPQPSQRRAAVAKRLEVR